ncbi:gluconate 2-dehydrogenase subunit 3 family protein [Candidatus Binatia bacterium]|nr:gluconate 2-dehydrogenase subunit 3 family protein [Candidatus Binatia bacterium]
MPAELIALDHQYVLNFAGRCLARADGAARHDYGQYGDAGDSRSRACEGWRFPLIDSYRDAARPEIGARSNRVTFVYAHQGDARPPIAVIGTFATLFEPLPLEPVTFVGEPTAYVALSVLVPKGQVHRYKLLVDGVPVLDPVNPQRVTTADGEAWSRFFTELTTQPLVLSRRELLLLTRLTDHILPFRTTEGQRFLQYFYSGADRQAKDTQYARAYRLDQPVGVVNFIDKLLAREENHHAIDYRLCLAQIDAILSRRHPTIDVAAIPKESFIDLYGQLASGSIDGWDYASYREPQYFLKLLRRHTYTGAFSHPRHGGNVGAVAWAYLESTFRDDANASCFAWQRALEPPLGDNAAYVG